MSCVAFVARGVRLRCAAGCDDLRAAATAADER